MPRRHSDAPSSNPDSRRSKNLDLLTVTEVAAELRVTGTFVRSQIKSGELPAFQTGCHWRIYRGDLRQYIIDRYNRKGMTSYADFMAADLDRAEKRNG